MSTAKFDTLSNLAGSQTVPVSTVAQGSAKAWVNFNGTGTVAIRASFNVSSITDSGLGQYTLNLTTALPDLNYAVVGSAVTSTATVTVFSNAALDATAYTSTSSVGVTTYANGNFSDSAIITVAVFR